MMLLHLFCLLCIEAQIIPQFGWHKLQYPWVIFPYHHLSHLSIIISKVYSLRTHIFLALTENFLYKLHICVHFREQNESLQQLTCITFIMIQKNNKLSKFVTYLTDKTMALLNAYYILNHVPHAHTFHRHRNTPPPKKKPWAKGNN